jgi:hypothetical protein
MIGASNTPFRIRPPRLIADSATESAANNAYASGLQAGQTKARDAAQASAGKGFSSVGSNAMFAAQQGAAGAADGARQAAGIRAEDQQFNAQQKWDNQMLQQQARAFDYGQMTDANDANFGYRFNNQSNRASIRNARQQASQNLRLALIGQGIV